MSRVIRVFLLLVLSAAPALARSPVATVGEEDIVNLLGYEEVFEDPSGILSFREVRADRSRFQPLRAERENVGYSRSVFWLRLRLCATATTLRYLELYQGIDDARLFVESPSGRVTEQQLGRLQPFSTRPVAHKNLYFPLSLAAAEPTTLYLRLRTADTLQLRARLLSPGALVRQIALSRLVAGLYLGALGALILYNFILYLWLRDRAYLYYVVFQCGVLSLQATLDQITLEYLWPSSPVWSASSETVFVGITLFGAFGFARHFLRSAAREAPASGSLRALEYAALGLAVLSPLTSSVRFVVAAMVFVLGSCVVLLVTGVVAWLRGSINARFFVLAWGFLLVATVISTLTALGLFSITTFAQETTRIGSAGEAILLSLGLAHRVGAMRRENERIQNDLLVLRTAEAARLELCVKERTRQLESTLDSLKNAQGRMVQQARLAALGHLVSGVVHEVGNPLNFLQGGAEDVRRRLEGIAEAVDDVKPQLPASNTTALDRALTAAFTGIELIDSGCRRISNVVKNLRALHTAEAVPLEATDLAAVTRDILALMDASLRQQGVEVSMRLEPVPAVLTRRGEIGQVLMNLVLNAAQAMPCGGTLTVGTRYSGENVEVSVADTGPGVPEAIRDAIFDPFFTTRGPNEGTGLGLSIAHQIAEQHGGTLRLSDARPGATFILCLPASTLP